MAASGCQRLSAVILSCSLISLGNIGGVLASGRSRANVALVPLRHCRTSVEKLVGSRRFCAKSVFLGCVVHMGYRVLLSLPAGWILSARLVSFGSSKMRAPACCFSMCARGVARSITRVSYATPRHCPQIDLTLGPSSRERRA